MSDKDLVKANLVKEVTEFKKELFNLKLNKSTAHVKDYSQFRKLRVKVAKALTQLKGQENVRT